MIKPFYKENAGLFVFVFTMMFFIVSKVDGAELYEYHYSLILAVLNSPIVLMLVFFIWWLYIRKAAGYVSVCMHKVEFTFLHALNSLSKTKRLRLWLLVEVSLFLPILLYAVLIILVGWQRGFYNAISLVTGFLLFSVFITAVWHLCQLEPLWQLSRPRAINRTLIRWPVSLSFQLLRFVLERQPLLWVGVKLFTCGVLCLIAMNNAITASDIGPVFLLYNFGVLANGVVVFRIRSFEETYLSFYRGLAIPLWKRFLQYSFLYLLLLVPEVITLLWLSFKYLDAETSILFAVCGYSTIWLMSSLSFIKDFSKREYLKILCLVFGVQYLFLLSLGLFPLSVLLLLLASVAFFRSYYQFERGLQH